MARYTYFAFHYQYDIWRVNQIRHHHLCRGGYEDAGYFDASLWEEAQRKGDAAIKRMIDKGLEGTSVTAVLIGSQTAHRTYVNYEIEQSIARGNGLIGIYIHNCADRTGFTCAQGLNPLDYHDLTVKYQPYAYSIPMNRIVRASQHYKTYDWINNNGYNNFENWVDEAYRLAGKE
jgi:hypothetical protein